MAQEFKLLSVLWLVCIVLGTTTSTAGDPITVTPATTTTTTTTTAAALAVESTTVTPATTTTKAVDSTTVTPATTTTTTTKAVDSTTVTPATTTKATTTTTKAVDSTTVTPATTTTTTTKAVDSTTVTPATTTTTTTKAVDSTTSTPATTTKATTTTTKAVDSTTVTPATTTTTKAVDSTTVTPATTTKATTTTTKAVDSTTVTPATTTKATTTTTKADDSTTVTPATTTTTTEAVDSTTKTPATTTKAQSTTTLATTTPVQSNTTTLATTTARPATTPALTTTKLPDPCEVNTCGDGSTCEPRANQTVVCLCLAGDFYNDDNKRCENSKVFPGQLNLPGLPFNEKMAIKTSSEFQDASQKVIDQLTDVFGKLDGYSGSTVLELKSSVNSKVWSRSENTVNASVDIAFTPNANIKTNDIEDLIVTASQCAECLLAKATFTAEALCHKNPCDMNTTLCADEDGSYNCSCKDTYIKTDLSSRVCIACPSGKKAEDSICVNCPFGYSGLNCNESWQRMLVIIGSVLGGLLLITLILLPIVASKCSKKSSKKNKDVDIGKPYVSHSPAKAPFVNHSLANSRPTLGNGSANGLAALGNAGVPRIPRATTTNSWDSRTNLEMTPSNSRQNLIPVGRNSRLYEDQDDMNPYSQARPQNSLYAQARPQNNPYAQNRPQINPYGSSQGQSNPYYMHDDGRRFN